MDRRELMQEMDQLAWEVETLWNLFTASDFYGNTLHWPNAHYGYMIACFSRIDRVSLFWDPGAKSQTHRMRGFMAQYLYPRKFEEISVAVQLWRHTLMHVGKPLSVRDKRTGQRYSYLLHFGDWLPKAQHFTLTLSATEKILNIGIMYLVTDLRVGISRYLDDLDADVHGAQAKYEQGVALAEVQDFS